MKTHLIAALASSVLLASPAELRSIYEPDEVRSINFTIESSSDLVDMMVLMNGEEGPGMPGMEQSKSQRLVGRFVDTTRITDAGNLLAFDREYSDLSQTIENYVSNPMMGERDDSDVRTSELDELTVVFASGDDGFEASFPEDSSEDEQLLAGLAGPLPWEALLPDSEVELRDEWEVPAEAFWSFVTPGGKLSFESGSMTDDLPDGVVKIAPSPEDAEVEGDCKAHLIKIAEIDGVRHATIAFELELSTFEDLTELMLANETSTPEDLPEGAVLPEIESFEVETEFSGEGTLVWNLETRTPSSLEFTLDSTKTETVGMSIDAEQESLEVEQISVFEGQLHVSFEVEVQRD